ncbi:Ubiquitin-conjugating enzyme E2 15 [Spiromyces aspiralis]|uniref:Ubiquitin-conjugating enzyme E2 15 n=1 Tax=Spiromyces aspiralis TaxID=68401 RepID=A0ACC1HRK4_9FUNG|nr:Ubiquitin-conjugating enzyme E2 15 [Spiromyces aspiralis]
MPVAAVWCEEGIFRAILEFPQSYPLAPPTLKFITEMWHPNIYSDGKVCISILHSPGEDPLGYEQAAERWSPAQSVEKIMLSVISLLYTPDASSPANVDAALELRNDSKKYFKKVRRLARRTAPS